MILLAEDHSCGRTAEQSVQQFVLYRETRSYRITHNVPDVELHPVIIIIGRSSNSFESFDLSCF